MSARRSCGPCQSSFYAPTEEEAEKLLQEHQRQSHPDAHAIGQLVEKLDRLTVLLEETLEERPSQ